MNSTWRSSPYAPPGYRMSPALRNLDKRIVASQKIWQPALTRALTRQPRSRSLSRLDNIENTPPILTSTVARDERSTESEIEPDYKALWLSSQKEVARLQDQLDTSERQLRDSRATVARLTHVNQNSLSELEKREKRAMERKLSEMEEELKQLQKLKAENERLRAENRALTRVVSKLTNSAAK